jgi:DNA-binding MarR family transcriptional regulator/predicted GNAT family N-acyltransferase
VLWEIAETGSDVRTLRARLGLDSGYLSRLLRSLEGDGLIETTPSRSDTRVRTVRLTRSGRTERALLDKHSDELAASLLAPLNPRQRSQLVDAVATVEMLLTAGLVEIDVEDPAGQAAQFCIDSYFAELDTRFENGFDPREALPLGIDDMTEPTGLLLLARLRREPVGCGALRLRDGQPPEVKRMWVAESARGLGIGRRLLAELEDHARRRGAHAVRLETNKALTQAIRLYRSAGYNEVDPFNDEPFAHHWFEKRLERDAPDR